MTNPQMCEKIKEKFNSGQKTWSMDWREIKGEILFKMERVIEKNVTQFQGSTIQGLIFGDYQFLKTVWPGDEILCPGCGSGHKREGECEGYLGACDYCRCVGGVSEYEYHAGELGKMCARECTTGEMIAYIAGTL